MNHLQLWTCSDCGTAVDADEGNHSFEDCVQTLKAEIASLQRQLAAKQTQLNITEQSRDRGWIRVTELEREIGRAKGQQ